MCCRSYSPQPATSVRVRRIFPEARAGAPVFSRRCSPCIVGAMQGGVHATDGGIIGAGPVGLFAVFECGMLEMRCHLFDALDLPGGQCVALYPEKPIYDIPGYPRIGAAELVDRLVEQAAPFAPVYHRGQPVETIAGSAQGGFVLATASGARGNARAAILAAAGGPRCPS